MRTIHRDIVGGFIFSSDSKVLLGKNKKGGIYEGSYVVPGGGVDYKETKEQALRREMLKETGIDIAHGVVSQINISSGEHEKTPRDTGERVFVKMNFYDYKITLSDKSSEINVVADDDWTSPRWFTPEELKNATISLPTSRTLRKVGF